jgi:hypothetical protein
LADESGYVIKRDKHGAKLMLINFGIECYGMDDEERESYMMNNDFCQKLKAMMPTFHRDDSEQFFSIFGGLEKNYVSCFIIL